MYFVIAFITLLTLFQKANAVEISVPHYIARDYREFTSQHPEDLEAVTELGQATRTTIEILVLKKALALGGKKTPISFNVASPTEGRIMMNIAKGVRLIGGPVWENEIDPRLYASSPIIMSKQLSSGFFGLPENTELFNVRSVKQLRLFTGVRVIQWKNMQQQMEQMRVRSVTATDMPAVFKIIQAGRGDFTFLFPGQREDMAQIHNGIRLLPIPGIRMELDMSSHYVISKKHPKGEETYLALEKGLKILREQGAIMRAFTAAGVINEKMNTWENFEY